MDSVNAKKSSRTREALVVLGSWTLVALLSVTYSALNRIHRNESPEWGRAFALNLLDWYILAAFTFVFLWLVRRWPLGSGRWRVIPLYLAVMTGLVLVKDAIYLPIRQALYPVPGFALDHVIFESFFYEFFELAAVVGVVHAIEYYRSVKASQLRSLQLEAHLSQAKLEALRNELQPHFLFNTLHAISTLIHRNAEAADEMVAQLGDLLRASLERKSVQQVPLREELSVLEPYLKIARIRFGDRLSISEQVEPELLDARVPVFILQPLVENAIQHGIERRPGSGRIEIVARAQRDSIQLIVSDDGAGVTSDAAIANGIGLSNTRMRLEQLYGSAAGLELRPRPDSGTEVVITIPRDPRIRQGARA
jgi:two-component sensor histidine kinase